MKKHILLLITGGFLTLIPATRTLADTHTESPDAGTTESSAQKIPRNVTEVSGFIGPGTEVWSDPNPRDVDVFCFTIDRAISGASITVISPDGAFDPNLLLLREGFFGIWGDDDSGGGIDDLDSNITTNLSAGTYYIAIGNNNICAYQQGSVNEDDSAWGDDGELAPGVAALPIAFIGACDTDTNENANYRVVFNFATADDPATAAIRKSLERKVKKLKKKIKKAKGTTKSKKLKKKLKKLKKKLNRL